MLCRWLTSPAKLKITSLARIAQAKPRGIADIGRDDLDMRGRAAQIARICAAAFDRGIHHCDFGAVRRKLQRQITADKAETTRDKNLGVPIF